jgi:Aldolase/RraA
MHSRSGPSALRACAFTRCGARQPPGWAGVSGPACRQRPYFLEALEGAAPGDVLVVDNGGRLDESCVGDLVALEPQAAGLEGIVTWGLHRDTADMRAIGLPVFSLGAIPAGPLRLDVRPQDALESATVGTGRSVGRTWSTAMTMACSFASHPSRGHLHAGGDDPRQRAPPGGPDPCRCLPAQSGAV